jgi:CheY-like chemotaxis protein
MGDMLLTGKKVLVVDDDAKTVELAKLYLSRDGYRVLTSGDGKETPGLSRANHPANHPDILSSSASCCPAPMALRYSASSEKSPTFLSSCLPPVYR